MGSRSAHYQITEKLDQRRYGGGPAKCEVGEDVIGQRIAHYEVAGLIGEGGTRKVYKASDTRLKRDVALKVLPESATPAARG